MYYTCLCLVKGTFQIDRGTFIPKNLKAELKSHFDEKKTITLEMKDYLISLIHYIFTCEVRFFNLSSHMSTLNIISTRINLIPRPPKRRAFAHAQ